MSLATTEADGATQKTVSRSHWDCGIWRTVCVIGPGVDHQSVGHDVDALCLLRPLRPLPDRRIQTGAREVNVSDAAKGLVPRHHAIGCLSIKLNFSRELRGWLASRISLHLPDLGSGDHKFVSTNTPLCTSLVLHPLHNICTAIPRGNPPAKLGGY
jgi:hypothetical protein